MKYKAVIKLNGTKDSLRFLEANPEVNKDSLVCILSRDMENKLWIEQEDNKLRWAHGIVLGTGFRTLINDFEIIMKKPLEKE